MGIEVRDILGDDYNGPVEIVDVFQKAISVIQNPKYERILCSVSGGSDSAVMMDILERVKGDKHINYVFFNTGLEHKCVLDFIKETEKHYGVEIKEYRSNKPIPWTCKNVGVPFLSKYVSEMISRLQRHNFQWEDEPFEVLINKYEKCTQALKWWTNNACDLKGKWNIRENKWLKEYLIQNPPDFPISNRCCTYNKKDLAHQAQKELDIQLNIHGVRKSEGGVRSSAYKDCFSFGENMDEYRIIFWFTDEVKDYYIRHFNVKLNDLYTKRGYRRTGCTCCPYGRNLAFELEDVKEHDPQMYKAVTNIFGKSIEYTKGYREFVQEMNIKEKEGIVKAK